MTKEQAKAAYLAAAETAGLAEAAWEAGKIDDEAALEELWAKSNRAWIVYKETL